MKGSSLAKFENFVYPVMRIVVGFLFACHGAQKLFGVLGSHGFPHNPQMVAAGLIELIGGVLVLIGFLTRLAAFIASGEMAVAYFTVHARDGFFPIVNKGELAALYCFVLLFIATRGVGRWGIDKS